MAITRELILEPADLSRVSIQCKGCDARVEILREATERTPDDPKKKKSEIPARCPSCRDDWSAILQTVDELFRVVRQLASYNVTFRVPDGGRASH